MELSLSTCSERAGSSRCCSRARRRELCHPLQIEPRRNSLRAGNPAKTKSSLGPPEAVASATPDSSNGVRAPTAAPLAMAAPWVPPSVVDRVCTGWAKISALIWFQRVLVAPPPVQRTEPAKPSGHKHSSALRSSSAIPGTPRSVGVVSSTDPRVERRHGHWSLSAATAPMCSTGSSPSATRGTPTTGRRTCSNEPRSYAPSPTGQSRCTWPTLQ